MTDDTRSRLRRWYARRKVAAWIIFRHTAEQRLCDAYNQLVDLEGRP